MLFFLVPFAIAKKGFADLEIVKKVFILSETYESSPCREKSSEARRNGLTLIEIMETRTGKMENDESEETINLFNKQEDLKEKFLELFKEFIALVRSRFEDEEQKTGKDKKFKEDSEEIFKKFEDIDPTVLEKLLAWADETFLKTISEMAKLKIDFKDESGSDEEALCTLL